MKALLLACTSMVTSTNVCVLSNVCIVNRLASTQCTVQGLSSVLFSVKWRQSWPRLVSIHSIRLSLVQCAALLLAEVCTT
jgi:hypothetical protein